MVYVFGIDIPLMELLFVYSFLTFYVLILVFLELRKLNKLIRMEKGDIQLIEDKSESPLDKFLSQAHKQGHSKGEVRKMLIDKGWDKKKVNELLLKY